LTGPISTLQRSILSDVEFLTGFPISSALENLKKLLRAESYGWVSGVITGAPHLKFALQGRPPGTAPPVAEIMKWMAAKPVVSKFSARDSAFLIARKIGAVGTKEPHFTQKLMTRFVAFSASRMVSENKRIFSKQFGKKYVDYFIGLTKFMENIEYKRT